MTVFNKKKSANAVLKKIKQEVRFIDVGGFGSEDWCKRSHVYYKSVYKYLTYYAYIAFEGPHVISEMEHPKSLPLPDNVDNPISRFYAERDEDFAKWLKQAIRRQRREAEEVDI